MTKSAKMGDLPPNITKSWIFYDKCIKNSWISCWWHQKSSDIPKLELLARGAKNRIQYTF
jgi:hypothetical protein